MKAIAQILGDVLLAIVFCALVYWIWLPESAHGTNPPTNATANQFECNLQVAYGLSWQANQVLCNYIEPGTSQANYPLATTIYVPPSTTAQAVNLATLFPYIQTALFYSVQDVSNPGQAFSFSTASAGNYIPIAAGGFAAFRTNCPIGSAPTIYLSNADTVNYCIVKVSGLAN